MSAGGTPENPLVCSRCGAENFDFASFCIGCGESLWPGDGTEVDSASDHSPAPATESEPLTHRKGPRGRSNRRARVWETASGVLILVLVLGYALYSWESTNIKSGAYHRAEAAALAKDWEKAVAGYQQAGDYMDANVRIKDARQKIAERDRLYDDAVRAQGRGDLERALSDLQQVHAIQPRYRDADTRLAAVEDRVFNKGLTGLVYQVSQGPDSGLYLRDAQGKAHPLPRSDAASTIKAVSRDGQAFVYDVSLQAPGENGARSNMLACLRADGSVSTTALPGLPAGDSGVFTAQGLWWYSPEPASQSDAQSQPPPNQIRPRVPAQPGRTDYEVYYAALDGTHQIVKVSDLQGGKHVLATDPVRSKVVLAQPAGQQHTDYWETEIYLADARGQGARLLQTVPGQVNQASISSDGRWIILVTLENTANAERLILGLRLDQHDIVPGQAALRQLDEMISTSLRPGSFPAAMFVPSGDGKHQVLLTRHEIDGDSLQLYDLDKASTTLLWSGPVLGASGFARGIPASALSPDGRYAVIRRQDKSGPSLQLVDLASPVANAQPAPIAADIGQLFRLQFAPEGGYLLASVVSRQSYSVGSAQQLYASRLLPDGQLGEMQPIATTAPAREAQAPTVAMPNGKLLVYVNPVGELHAVFADGTGDTRLAVGVGAVWSLQPATDGQ